MEFKEFKNLFQEHVATLLQNHSILFVTGADKDRLWNTYLDSFPPGTNEIFRERREFDCSCCKQFIRSFGKVVAIQNDNQLVSIWDFQAADSEYQPVIDALSAYVKAVPVHDVFVTKESAFGTDKNYEQLEDGTVRTWDHFRIDLPKQFVARSAKSEASLMGEYRDTRNVFKRSLEEISQDAIDTVLDLISQNSLYKGEEWQSVLTKFFGLHRVYHALPESEKDNYCWRTSVDVGAAIGKIKNHSMGVLLVDITGGMDLNEAVRKYEAIVAPTNYKRPKAIFTKKMIQQAQETITELGFLDSLGRRFATIEDITVNNILFVNRDSMKRICGDVFAELQQEAVANPKQFDRVEEVPVEQFLEHILPRTTELQVYIENRHEPNLVSVIAPHVKDAPTMFKWVNGFSWAYNGNITDSMKARVKAFGGRVENVVSRFSIQWNEDKGNNDLDAHCVEPNKRHIYYPNKGRIHPSSGSLDVDIIYPSRDVPNDSNIAVENIVHTSKDRMPEGTYHYYVHCYSYRGGNGGFSAELELDGEVHEFSYPHAMRQDEHVTVAKVKFDHEQGFSILESLPSSLQTRTVWGVQTNTFVPVSVCMFSPNYWDRQTGIGHRHYFFILTGCLNDMQPNGFFNEFLREDLMKHKRVFEALGGKMRVESSDNQLSGIGFSSTKKNSLICKVEGHVTRTIKLIF